MAASSNVQLQQIQQKLQSYSFRNPQVNQKQISMLKDQLSRMDQNNLPLYSSTLERLYTLQNSTPNVEVINDLLTQKIQILETLTNKGN
jgi:type II secretory pathway component PulF